jgi:hypothetical protein
MCEYLVFHKEDDGSAHMQVIFKPAKASRPNLYDTLTGIMWSYKKMLGEVVMQWLIITRLHYSN